MKIKLLYFLILLSIFACNVEKRKYQKGFYISTTGKVNVSTPTLQTAAYLLPPDSCDKLVFSDGTKISGRILSISPKAVQYSFCNDQTVHRIARQRLISIQKLDGSIDYFDGRINTKEQPVPPITIAPETSVNPAPAKSETIEKSDSLSGKMIEDKPALSSTVNPTQPVCETIILRNGEEISAKVTEVGITDVRYKLCSMPDGPDFVKPKSEIFMIRYKDGSKDLFKEPVAGVYEENSRQVPKNNNNGLSILSLTFSILGIYPLTFLGSIVGMITGIVYLRKNPFEQPGSSGRKRAIAGIIMSGIMLLLLAALIAAFVI